MDTVSLQTSDPSSWHDLSEHPAINDSAFDKSWYDGDLDADLSLLREACELVTQTLSGFNSELVVLDDFTFCATLSQDNVICCDIYPAMTTNDQRCLFFHVPSSPNLEIRVMTASDAKIVVTAIANNEDLLRFESIL